MTDDEASKLPFGVIELLKPFKPCVDENHDLRLTTYMHEDVPCFARPMTKLHGVDALLAMDDRRLVGVQFWGVLSDKDNPMETREWPDED